MLNTSVLIRCIVFLYFHVFPWKIFLCIALKKKKTLSQLQLHHSDTSGKISSKNLKGFLAGAIKLCKVWRRQPADSDCVFMATGTGQWWVVTSVYPENRLVLKQVLPLGSDRSSESASMTCGWPWTSSSLGAGLWFLDPEWPTSLCAP